MAFLFLLHLLEKLKSYGCHRIGAIMTHPYARLRCETCTWMGMPSECKYAEGNCEYCAALTAYELKNIPGLHPVYHFCPSCDKQVAEFALLSAEEKQWLFEFIQDCEEASGDPLDSFRMNIGGLWFWNWNRWCMEACLNALMDSPHQEYIEELERWWLTSSDDLFEEN